jgi:hypothetical protein
MTEFRQETGDLFKDHRNMKITHRGSYNDPKKRHNWRELQERFVIKQRVYDQKLGDIQEALKKLPARDDLMTHDQLEKKRRLLHKLNEFEHKEMKCESEVDYLDRMIERNHINLINQPLKQGKHKTKLISQNIINY